MVKVTTASGHPAERLPYTDFRSCTQETNPMKTLIASFAAVAALAFANPASAAPPQGTPFSFPVNVVSADQGTFVGNLKIARFAVDNGTLVASGVLSGTLTDENAVTTSIFRTVTVPVILPPSPAKGAAAAQIGCEVLHLELGPLDLDLL